MTRDEAIAHGKEQLEIFGGTHREFILMAIRSLEAWDKVKNDLDDLWLKGYSPHTEVMEIIDRHLKEVENDKERSD